MRRRRPSPAAGATRAAQRRPMTRSQTAAAAAAAAAAVAESLAEEIIIEILSRLPAMSLIRFKCVCKRWCSLISDPGFAKSHLLRLKAGDLISSQRIVKTGPIETIDYEAFDGGNDNRVLIRSHDPRIDGPKWMLELVGSCDGLICFEVYGRFLLYNPTTEESRNVRISDFELTDVGEFFHGFGYDPAFDDYKIVHAYHGDDDGDSEMWWVAIFSLKSGSWRRIQVQLDIRLGNNSGKGFYWHKSRQGICWNGALHWCLDFKELNNRGLYNRKPVIMSFDLSEEKFHQELPVPKLDVEIPAIVGLGIHGANLLMYTGNPSIIVAWIMNENGRGGSWTKLHSVSTEGICVLLPWDQIPIAYTRSGKIVFEFGANEMVLFNLEQHGSFGKFPILTNGGSAIYIETLVSPYLGCEPSRT